MHRPAADDDKITRSAKVIHAPLRYFGKHARRIKSSSASRHKHKVISDAVRVTVNVPQAATIKREVHSLQQVSDSSDGRHTLTAW